MKWVVLIACSAVQVLEVTVTDKGMITRGTPSGIRWSVASTYEIDSCQGSMALR